MTLAELNALIQGAIQMHGCDAKCSFLYQTKSGMTKVGDVTGYTVGGVGQAWGPTIRFSINHARGKMEPSDD